MKLHATITELQNNLQRTREVQEEEEKIKGVEITKLNGKIDNLKKNLKEAEEKAKVYIKLLNGSLLSNIHIFSCARFVKEDPK